MAIDRRRFLTGAVTSATAVGTSSVAQAQDAHPTPVPVRIQVPDLAFVDALQQQLAAFQSAGGANDLLLSIVPAEPASDSLLNDLRSNGKRFSGALVPYWLIPDLVRDDFISPAKPPPEPLPPAIAQLRSFGGEWIATDFDHDCDLLYLRADLLAGGGTVPGTWTELLALAESGGIRLAIPQTHAQQTVGHFCAMAASGVGTDEFWFDPNTMEPAIVGPTHQAALDLWRALARHTPAAVRAGSTGDLWESFLVGESAALVASAAVLPYALQRSLDPDALLVAPLPGVRNPAGELQRSGNVTGANWGGVAIAEMSGIQSVSDFFANLADPATQLELTSDVSSGLTPAARLSSAATNAFVGAGWPVSVTGSWLAAIAETVGNPVQLSPLRIAETRRYLLALENRLIPFLAGEAGSAADTLEAAAADWRAFNDAIGVETQQDLYRRSRMPAPDQ